MSRRPVKHSVTLNGHRTSVSLEDEFWLAFRDIAAQKQIPINALVAEIDVDRGTETRYSEQPVFSPPSSDDFFIAPLI